jgi:uncharacterized protein YjbJ (UPF0337 family)
MKDKMRGKAEEIKGKVTGDRALQIKGQARQKVGGVKEAAKSIAYDVDRSSRKRSNDATNAAEAPKEGLR